MNRVQFNYMPPKNSPITSYYFKLYENQQKFGSTIFNQYVQNQSLIHTLAIAPTQSGKTGSMLSIIHHAISHQTHGVPIENVFIFTPHSSREWLLQTKERFPPSMSANIFHRNNFKKLIAAMQHKTNILLILDEVQIAFKLGQTTFNLFNQLGFYDLHNLFQKNIKIVSFTATPNQLVQDFALWKNMASVLYMDVPNSYISHQTLLRSNRLKQMKDLTGFDKVTGTVNPVAFDNIREIISVVNTLETPKYHIIRTPRANLHLLTMQNFRQVFKDDDIQFVLVSETTIQDFDQFISSPPSQHTFIFIKDKLRCAKTLEKAHIGVLYERFVNKPINSTPSFRVSPDALPDITKTIILSFSLTYLPFIIIINLTILSILPNANLLLSILFKQFTTIRTLLLLHIFYFHLFYFSWGDKLYWIYNFVNLYGLKNTLDAEK